MILFILLLENKKNEQEVEEVIGKSCIKREIYYLVKQISQLLEYNQWVCEDYIANVQDTIRKFSKIKKGQKANKDLAERLLKA